MEALSLSSAKFALNSFNLHPHYFRLFSLSSSPILHRLKSAPFISSIPPNRASSINIKCCKSFTAKSSSELRKLKQLRVNDDEKLRALRELFSKPGVGIDAYIIPSQDAHQVILFFFSTLIFFLIFCASIDWSVLVFEN
ncbi:unnamed protein product [Amaranthus hypochondriacus]